ncbi:response regulator transcription factor [Granulicella sp. L60]|uniref:response regulator transcription factor n=1 Tax=Granulicella sp. L60 TaxID=1641866 RepID=UPI0020B128DB|nr:response regulator transcription factor [Granulicella sp. L60]
MATEPLTKRGNDSSRQTFAVKKRDNRTVTGLRLETAREMSPLLLIDDDRSLASLLAEYCGPAGFSITSALSGEDGLRMARQEYFLLIILDVTLSGIDGFEVLKRLRRSSQIPVLMLTTRGAAMDRVLGLENGADDYLAKPFQPEELVARIKTVLRRTHPEEQVKRIVLGDISLDTMDRSVTLSDQPLELTGAEFHLLKLLMSHPAKPLSREELIPRIFGRDSTSIDRSIDNLVNQLRRKLGSHADGSERIRSIRNIGYCYVIDADGADAS